MGKFLCRDKGVESFLKDKAFDFEHRNFARTYLLLDSASFEIGQLVILAYFTLSIKSLQFLPSLSNRKIKEIDGFSKEASAVGAILIGQLGKDEALSHLVTGTEVMSYAVSFIYDIFDNAACRVAFLECQPIDKLIAFYRTCGFEPLQTSRNGLLQMVRFL